MGITICVLISFSGDSGACSCLGTTAHRSCQDPLLSIFSNCFLASQTPQDPSYLRAFDCSHRGCMTFSGPLALCANTISSERPSRAPGLKIYSHSIRLNSLSYCAFFLAFNTTWYSFPCLFIYLPCICLHPLEDKLHENRDVIFFVLPASRGHAQHGEILRKYF